MNLFLLTCLGIIFNQDAYAYLDPQTGSYLFQVLIAVSLSAVFTIKLWWSKVKSIILNLFSGRKKDA